MASKITIEMRTMEHEVACIKHGRPSYRWAIGYLVPTPEGELFPPVGRSEAFSIAREIYGQSVKILVI